MLRILSLLFVLAALPLPCAVAAESAPGILVFSRTTGFRHDSIAEGIEAIRRIGDAHGLHIEATEDPEMFNPAILNHFNAVIFLNTSGNVLSDVQRIAFQRYIEEGGGFVGIHAAADTEYDWPWYERLVGTRFSDHPPIQSATVRVHDRSHPSTAHLPARWVRTDEWYNYRYNPRGRVHVLATLDTDSYEGSTMGTDHPITWCSYQGRGRSWYTGGGHTAESFTEPEFTEHLAGGILWAAGLAQDHGLPGIVGMFRAVVVAEELEDPIAMSWAGHDDLIILSRDGMLTRHDLNQGSREVIGTLNRDFTETREYAIRIRWDATDPSNPIIRALVPSMERPGRTDVLIVELGDPDQPRPVAATLERVSPLRNMPETGWFLAESPDHVRGAIPRALDGTIVRPGPDRRILILVWRDDGGRHLAAERFAGDLPWIHPFDINQGPCGRIFVLDREFPDRTEAAFGRVVRLDWIGDQHVAARP